MVHEGSNLEVQRGRGSGASQETDRRGGTSTKWRAGTDVDLAKRYVQGKIPESWWSKFSPVGRLKRERIGYPTQKPLALLDRIIKASSNPGDVVLDPFCGCATACVSAESLRRQWIGIDLSPVAATIVESRLHDQFVEPACRFMNQ